MNSKAEKGFTLLEVMLVIIILSIIAVIVIPRFSGSSDLAREKADIISGQQVKSALDRYQVENGLYPLYNEMKAEGGNISCEKFIPAYIKQLDTTITQQNAPEANKGFGVAQLGSGDPPAPTNLIMIYLSTDGSKAEVKVFNKNLNDPIWSSD